MHQPRIFRAFCLTFLALLALWPCGEATACAIIIPGEAFEIVADGRDTTPPNVFVFDGLEIKRGRDGNTSCDDLGRIALMFTLGDDASDVVGLEYRIVSGTPPEGMGARVGDDFSSPLRTDTLVWSWIDGDTDDQEAFEFVVEVRAVDRAGHRTEPMAITVADEGSSACHTNPRRTPATPAAALIAILGLVAIRQRMRAASPHCTP